VRTFRLVLLSAPQLLRVVPPSDAASFDEVCKHFNQRDIPTTLFYMYMYT
jgi:hypothetical protein